MIVKEINGTTYVCLDPENDNDTARVVKHLPGTHRDTIRASLRDIVREES